MKNMKAKLAALEAMSSRGMGEEPKPKVMTVVVCPKCGHEMDMENMDSEDKMDSEDTMDSED